MPNMRITYVPAHNASAFHDTPVQNAAAQPALHREERQALDPFDAVTFLH